MSEFGIVILILAGVLVVIFVQQMPPGFVYWGIIAILNLMNLAITLINLWQARARDKRFLHAGYLGLIMVVVGVFLFGLFSVFWGLGAGTYATSLPFLAGGLITLLGALLYRIFGK